MLASIGPCSGTTSLVLGSSSCACHVLEWLCRPSCLQRYQLHWCFGRRKLYEVRKELLGCQPDFPPNQHGTIVPFEPRWWCLMQSTYNAPAPAPAPAQPAYQSSFAQPAAPAPAPYQSSFAPAPAPAPYQSSFAQPAPAPAAAAPVNTGSYLANLGGGSSMPSGSVSKSYSGMADSFSRATTGQMAGATSGYLSNL